jgi:hypothetical protein
VKSVKQFQYLGICPLNSGAVMQDFIHAYLYIANTEDPVRENGQLEILPPSTEVITNFPPSPNVIRNANLTSEENLLPDSSCFSLEKLCGRKRRKTSTLQ